MLVSELVLCVSGTFNDGVACRVRVRTLTLTLTLACRVRVRVGTLCSNSRGRSRDEDSIVGVAGTKQRARFQNARAKKRGLKLE